MNPNAPNWVYKPGPAMDNRKRLTLDDRCVIPADQLVAGQRVITQDWLTGEARIEQVIQVTHVGDDVVLLLDKQRGLSELTTSARNTFVVLP